MIPEDVRRLVLTSIPSVPHLEAVMLLQRTPNVERSVDFIARALYLPATKVRTVLEELRDSGIFASRVEGEQQHFRYAPRTDELASVVDRLAAAYAADVVGVTNLIHDAAAKSAQRFADAFKLRKER